MSETKLGQALLKGLREATGDKIVTETNKYPIVNSYLCFRWQCPRCDKVNHISKESYIHQKAVDECTGCEQAVNLME